MVETYSVDETSLIEDLRKEVSALAERLAALESRKASPAVESLVAPPSARAVAPKPEPQPEATPEITQEELLAISGALAAYFGVRVHIRQIRLIGSSAWFGAFLISEQIVVFRSIKVNRVRGIAIGVLERIDVKRFSVR